ncbi:Mediator of RNA polymerase II transcription subunit 18 [Microtus ochrogaster]|nr:Mediator of RNA polymerase II transcription subunit 18 [Microtus ochrogaster]
MHFAHAFLPTGARRRTPSLPSRHPYFSGFSGEVSCPSASCRKCGRQSLRRFGWALAGEIWVFGEYGLRVCTLGFTSSFAKSYSVHGAVLLVCVPCLAHRKICFQFLLWSQIRDIMEAPPVTMMPVTGGTINMMEYLLQGSVLDHSLESLIHRLRGLCDNMEPETFLDHEMVFLLKGQQASPFVLRARRSMDRAGAPWHLRYLGQPEMGDKNRHALVRNCVDIATSENLTDFLMEMGFRMDHEFVAKGHLFRKGIMKIVVYKIFRILVPGNTDSTEALSLSYLVELSVVAPAGQDMVSDDMRNFAEQLKPLVHLEKIDPKRLM